MANQTTNQQGKQPTNQAANQPTNPTNQPTNQPKISYFLLKIHSKSTKLEAKIHQIGSQDRSKSVPKGFLERSWGGLGAKKAPRAKNDRKCKDRLRLLGTNLGAKIQQNSNFKAIQKVIVFLIDFWINFLANLVPFWCQNDSPTLPKWMPFGSKMHASWDVNLRVTFEGILAPFSSIFQHNMTWSN